MRITIKDGFGALVGRIFEVPMVCAYCSQELHGDERTGEHFANCKPLVVARVVSPTAVVDVLPEYKDWEVVNHEGV